MNEFSAAILLVLLALRSQRQRWISEERALVSLPACQIEMPQRSIEQLQVAFCAQPTRGERDTIHELAHETLRRCPEVDDMCLSPSSCTGSYRRNKVPGTYLSQDVPHLIRDQVTKAPVDLNLQELRAIPKDLVSIVQADNSAERISNTATITNLPLPTVNRMRSIQFSCLVSLTMKQWNGIRCHSWPHGAENASRQVHTSQETMRIQERFETPYKFSASILDLMKSYQARLSIPLASWSRLPTFRPRHVAPSYIPAQITENQHPICTMGCLLASDMSLHLAIATPSGK